MRRETSEVDKRLIAALQPGLPLVSRPFAQLAETVGLPESALVERLAEWLDDGCIKRMGVVVRHHELGYKANAMVVFDVPDDQVSAVGQRLAHQAGVTLCTRRERHLPYWTPNLYCMVHGRSREEVEPIIDRLCRVAGYPCEALFSLRRFKQCGALLRCGQALRWLTSIRRIVPLINALQGGFPLVERPFAAVGAQLGIDEEEVIARIEFLKESGVLTRFGPMFQIERMGGAFVLAALAVPEERYEEVTALVNQLPAVAHNYRRQHALNMWFVRPPKRRRASPQRLPRLKR